MDDPHEGKRKCESNWDIHRIHWKKNRFIYDLYYKNKVERPTSSLGLSPLPGLLRLAADLRRPSHRAHAPSLHIHRRLNFHYACSQEISKELYDWLVRLKIADACGHSPPAGLGLCEPRLNSSDASRAACSSDLEVAQTGLRDPVLVAGDQRDRNQLRNHLDLPGPDAAARWRRDTGGVDWLRQLRVRGRGRRDRANLVVRPAAEYDAAVPRGEGAWEPQEGEGGAEGGCAGGGSTR